MDIAEKMGKTHRWIVIKYGYIISQQKALKVQLNSFIRRLAQQIYKLQL